ncbi:hypothetical protein LUZ61_020917 [Rhynchospora tenuis]|uniref:Uncharacterized protein n=1 Tax=Rhynchospora tenuis TaxID=198213 RepID=A0AAD5ZDW8_9POAL|nr:hypothetical protein LUZ61_020917 [Rhynchospora tenuis]
MKNHSRVKMKQKNKVKHQSDDYCNTMDPLYKLFLDHLTPDGTSYILEIDDPDLGLGVPLYLKYEGDNTSSYCKPQTNSLIKKTKNKKSGPILEKTKRKRRDQIGIAPLAEESYERFLKHLKLKQGIMILELDGGRKIIYEEDRENISSNVATENGVDTGNQALVPHTDTSGSNGEKNVLAVISPDLRSFDEKLAAVLSNPFDQHEYEALMNEAIRRKPVMKHRNLRNMSKGYRTHEAGQSYLDYYPDLAIQITEADKYERLNLLRKFFFWLENLCHEGAYMPWAPKALSDKLVFD